MEIPKERFKDIEIEGRHFRLNKMNARTGSYMLFKVISIVSPIIKNINLDQLEEINVEDLNLTELLSSLFNLEEKDFNYIQDNCLKVVEEILPAGPARVLDEYGNFGVLDMEFNTPLILNLTVRSLIFNVQDFFSESLWGPLLTSVNSYLQNLEI